MDIDIKSAHERKDHLYVLRRTLPPWRWRENLDELITRCREHRIDEVCIKIDTGTFTHYYPDKAWLENYQQILFRVKEELNAIGVAYSLNPNVTQGHGDRGRHINRLHPDWPMLTDRNGVRATDCACNIGQGWRDYIRHQWTLYAQTHPAAIWMEDDLRTYHHGPVGVGCFCNEHIRRFNLREGTDLNREQLVARIFALGNPDPLRARWLDFLNEMTLEVMHLCEGTIHSVSPQTLFGLMFSDPAMHAGEGRDWVALRKILSADGRQPILVRPPLGNYSEASLNGLCYTSTQIGAARAVLGNDCLEQGEIENYPYTGYAKSNTFTLLQNSVAIGSGIDALTLNLYDHSGTPMALTGDILQALSGSKPYLSALKRAAQPRRTETGVSVYSNPASGYYKKLDANSKGVLESEPDLFDVSPPILSHLKALGVAATLLPGGTNVLAGESIRAASPEAIRHILTEGAFIDAVAFKALCDMGYSKWLGADYERSFILNTTEPLAGEHFHNENFGGGGQHAFCLSVYNQKPLFTVMRLHPAAEEITEFVDPDFRRLHPGTFAFTNELGGRIVVFPLELAALNDAFRTPTRKHWLHALLKWISCDTLPLVVSGDRNLLPLRFDRGHDTLVGLYNLSLDPLCDIHAVLHIEHRVTSVRQLPFNTAEWKPFPHFEQHENKLIIRIDELLHSAPRYFWVS